MTWSVTGGVDQGKFTIDSATGALTFVAVPDFEIPTDTGANNVYDPVVTATDRNGNTSSQTVTITVLDVNEDPMPRVITGPSGGAGAEASAMTVAEGQKQAAVFAANEGVT